MRHIAIASVLVATACFGCSSASREDVQSSEHADTASIVSAQACPTDNRDPQCPTGSFAVICKDGSHEVDTAAQLEAGQACSGDGRKNCACDPASGDCDGTDGDNDDDDVCRYPSCATAPDGTPCGGTKVCSAGTCGESDCGFEYTTVFADEAHINCISNKVAALSGANPRDAITYAGRQLIHELSYLWASNGGENSQASASPTDRQIIDFDLQYHHDWSTDLNQFWSVYETIEGGGSPSANDQATALSTANSLIRRIFESTDYRMVVSLSGLPVYSDPAGTNVRPGMSAVTFDHINRQGVPHQDSPLGPYPTTNTAMRKGMVVGWDWDMSSAGVGASWTRTPDGTVSHAWDSSDFFRGRELRQFGRTN